mmetsp:Transcript_26138/g.62178  ORF Transcript_26138/g.62178 Transcript_26138/m.62178 type:complete len:855 (+) Transcript_26138:308-2872(+)
MAGSRVTRLPRLNDTSLYESLPNMGKLSSEDQRSPSRTQNRASLPALSPSPRPGAAKTNGMESPRMFDEVELTEEEILALELKAVKNERSALISDLNTIKTEHTESGADIQRDDLLKMERHLEFKKQKYNEIHEEVIAKEKELQKLENMATDSRLRVPEEMEPEQARINKLRSEMESLEAELVEAEAKNRLYTLLGERPRREHMAMEKKVREAREMKEDCLEDHASLTSHMHDMRAAREESEKKLAQMKAQYQQGKSDWDRKLSLRKKEVAELRRRQQREKEKEDHKRAKEREKEERERRVQAAQQMQLEAYEMQCAALAPKIEAMEASWNRLRSISGAQTTEEVINYFFSLRSKEENMRELVSQAEKREAKAKQTLAEMLDARSEMFETALAGQDGTFEEHKSRIDDAERRLTQARKRFNRLRAVCISAEQGVKFLLARLMVALEEPVDDPDMKAMLASLQGGSKAYPKGSGKAEKPTEDGIGAEDEDAEGEQNRIDDVDFFPNLVDTVSRVGDRLNKLLVIEEEFKAAPPPEPEPEPEPHPEPLPESEHETAAVDEGKEAEGEMEGQDGDQPPKPDAEEEQAQTEETEAEAPAEAESTEGAVKEDSKAGADEESSGEENAEAKESSGGDEGEEQESPDGGIAAEENEQETEKAATKAMEDEPEGGETGEPGGPTNESAEEEAAEAEQVDAEVKDVPESENEQEPEATEAEPLQEPEPQTKPEPALSDTHESLTEEELQWKLLKQETKLAKGMKRTEWSGPYWVKTVTGSPIMPGMEASKRKKGKKKKDQPQPDLTRILGYTGSDVEEDEATEEEEDENDEEWDGFVDRDFIKHRSMKMTLKAQAMAHGPGRM